MSRARPRVLVADDHPTVAKAVCRLLAPDCEIVGTVADGRALLEAVPRLEPDVIVMDLNLPGVHGLEACRQLTSMHPALKVVVLSAMSEPEVTEALIAAGASAFVSKLASADLPATIRRLFADPSRNG
jgi:DNA-binding NarL/FixJ family response regulator